MRAHWTLWFALLQLARAPAASAQVTVQSVEVETKGQAGYFRITLHWPQQEVPASYSEFLGPLSRSAEATSWPVDSLALVPADGQSSLVFWQFADTDSHNSGRGELQPTATFVGKLKKPGQARFVLRCPQKGGQTSALPLDVDFAKAARGKDLQKAWERAEAEFFAAYPAPRDLGFFAYAHQVALARVEPKARAAGAREASRPDRSELYAVTTGALALQESLQLDRLRTPSRDKGARTIALDSIAGVSVASHPWEQMIGSRKPALEAIAALVPEDQYYLRFRTIKAMRAFLDHAEQWGGLVLSEADLGGRDYRARERIETELCLRASWLSELLGEAVVLSLAITGSDPYLREGSDFTLVFELKSEALFFAAVDRFLTEAKGAHPDLKQDQVDVLGVKVERYLTPDKSVRCHRARIGEYAVYSNSLAGITRVIETSKGKRKALKSALDFMYLRTLFPLDDPAEDGFLILSDPFLRHLTGPRLRIGEKRRIETLTTLELIKNAALLYLFENPGAAAPTLEQLLAAKLLKRDQIWTDPDDVVRFDPKAFQATSQRYGRTEALTPLIEIPFDKVSEQEKREYEQFRQNYQDYWRRYFDPVGIRITAQKREVALAVTILPLIDNSEYLRTKADIGGKAVELEPLPRGGETVLHFGMHLNPESDDVRALQTFSVNLLNTGERAAVEWLGERIEFFLEDSDAWLRAMERERFQEMLRVPAVLAVEVKSQLGLAAFLLAFKTLVDTSAPNIVVFEPQPKFRDFAFTCIKPSAQTVANDPDIAGFALCYGSVGSMLYLSNSLPSLQRVVDRFIAQKSDPTAMGVSEQFGAAKKAHLALRGDLRQGKSTRLALERLAIERAQVHEREHLRALWLVARTAGLGTSARLTPEQVLGYRVASALGNRFTYDAARDEVAGSVSGSISAPRAVAAAPEGSPLALLLQDLETLRATLEFTPEGLHTELSIRRAK